MKPQVRQIITAVAKTSPGLNTLNHAVGRIERARKHADDPEAGERMAKNVKAGVAILGVTCVAALAVNYVFSKEVSEIPKQTVTAEANMCDTQELLAEQAFLRALGRQASSDSKGLHIQEGRNFFDLEVSLEPVLRMELKASLGSEPGEIGGKTGSIWLVNPEVKAEKPQNTGDPGQWRGLLEGLVTHSATRLDAASLKGYVLGGNYTANGEVMHFAPVEGGCTIAADPHGFKPQNGRMSPLDIPAAAGLAVKTLTDAL